MEEQKREFYHALKINEQICIGCTHCISKCPTGALRILNGKAVIRKNWCIDCAECMKACPVQAIYVEQDDFNHIFDFKHRVLLMPALFFGQFPDDVSEHDITAALYSLGFTHIYMVESTVNIVHEQTEKKLAAADEKPLISSYCPAVVRLIQIRFPNLVDNILSVKTPIEITPMLYRKKLTDEGCKNEDIGMFYITPCAAKIAQIKGNEEYRHLINGVINMDTLFNKVYHIIKNKSDQTDTAKHPQPARLTSCEMRWCQTEGEASTYAGRNLAVDEIHNVIEFIERMESADLLHTVDFLELRACDRSCVGGVLAPANRFLATERIDCRASNRRKESHLYKDFGEEDIERVRAAAHTSPLKPMTKLLYDGNIAERLLKMERVRQLMCFLPGIDCCGCGSPGCQALAEDIVRGEANMSRCVFLQRGMEHRGAISGERAYQLIEKVWGKNRLDKNCKKKGAKNEGK